MHYKAVFHVDLFDENRCTLALNNISNTLDALTGKEKSHVLLANGPGVQLFAAQQAASRFEQLQKLHDAGVNSRYALRPLPSLQ